MNFITAMITSFGLLGATACADRRPAAPDRTDLAAPSPSDEIGDSDEPGDPNEVARTHESCPPPEPASLARPEIQARAVTGSDYRFRRRIERVDVLDLSSYRVRFSLDEKTVEALHQVPVDRGFHGSGEDVRPASLPAWNVAILIYEAGAELPVLGHVFDDGHLYFVDEEDPWNPAVYDADMNLRGVYGMAMDSAVDDFLTARLGEHDPFGQLAQAAKRAEDARCGRASPTPDDPPVDHLSQVRRSPELCPHLFKPSLVALEPPKIVPRNRAQAIQPIRRRIERVDVLDLSTYRVLFTFDDASVNALRQMPEDEVLSWRANERPASLPAWDVGLLIHVAGKELPYLGHFFDDMELYFVNEADPWDPAVFDRDGEAMRDVYGIPVDYAVDYILVKRLGEHDPFGQNEWRAQREEDSRCGRVSKRHDDPFPQFPKAIVEPAYPLECPTGGALGGSALAARHRLRSERWTPFAGIFA